MIPHYYVGQGLSAPRDQAEKIAVLGLEVVGAIDLESVRVARELTVALRSRAAEGPYAVAPNSEKELIDELVMHNCTVDQKACMAKIGRALGADRLLYGRVERRPRRAAPTGSYQVSLWLLDVDVGQLAPWTGSIPAADASGAMLAEHGRRGYEHLIAGVRPRRRKDPVADRVLINATNEAFWQLTRHKPGQQLDMADPRDRAMSKTWLDLYAQLRGRRDRAANLAKRILNETVTPYVLVIEQTDGSLTHRTFEHRSNLDVQYTWLVDQPEYYTYVAMFDFTENRDAPIRDQFAISKRQQMAVSGWHGW